MKNPWLNLQTQSPYLLEEDKKRFYKIVNLRNNVDLKLIPEAFVGDVESAEVIFLISKASINWQDFAWHENHHFKDLCFKSLHQEKLSVPFFFFDESVKDSPASKWWSSKLYKIVEQTSKESVAQKIAVIPFLPYHSSKQPSLSLLREEKTLPSQLYTKEVVDNAQKRGALIVIMNGPWLEFMPQLRKKGNVLEVNSRNNPVLSHNNFDNPKDFDKIIKRLK